MTAFCSITRPTRREIAQLDDLSGPLLNLVSDETLRFVAASLSETPHAPPILVRRLADQPPNISAPLLLRSPILGTIDLLALIGRHGAGHARVIAARRHVDQRLLKLAASLDADFEDEDARSQANRAELPGDRILASPPHAGQAEGVRGLLRTMMLPAEAPSEGRAGAVQLRWAQDPGDYRKLRSTALTGVATLFHTALANALNIDVEQAAAIVESPDISELIVALKSLDLSEEQAFVVAKCACPSRLAHHRSIAAFLDAYGSLSASQASQVVEAWRVHRRRADGASHRQAANAQEPPSPRLRAS